MSNLDRRLILRELSDVSAFLEGMRERAGLTKAQAIKCATIPITLSHLHNLEAGRKQPSLAVLLALCELYGYELVANPPAAGDSPAAVDEEAPPHVD